MTNRLLIALVLPFGLMMAHHAFAQDIVTRLPATLPLGLPSLSAPLVSIRPMPRDAVQLSVDHGLPTHADDLALRPHDWTAPGTRRPAIPLPGFMIGVFR